MQLITTAASVGSDLHRRVRWNKVHLFLFFSTHHAFVIYFTECHLLSPKCCMHMVLPSAEVKTSKRVFFPFFLFYMQKSVFFSVSDAT